MRGRIDPIVVGLWVPYVWLVHRFWFLCDDSYITFRYARNLARGRGITYNVGDQPVEGYSDFLWLLVAAAVEASGGAVEFLVPAVSALAGLAFLPWFFDRARTTFELSRVEAGIATAVLALSPAWALWSTSGLETLPYAVLLFILAERLIWSDHEHAWLHAGLAALGAALIRTEGIAWVGVVAGLALSVRLVDRPQEPVQAAVERVGRMLALAGAVFAVYTVWRFGYFGDWLPNTAHAKVGFSGERLLRGFKYVALFYATFCSVLVAALGLPNLIRWRVGGGLAVAALAIGFPLYSILIGGDFMPMGRMLLPSLPFVALMTAFAARALIARVADVRTVGAVVATVLTVGLLPAFDVHVVPLPIRESMHFRLSDKEFMSEYARWKNMVDNTNGFMLRGRALAQWAPRDLRMVSKAIGVAGYYSDLYIYDQYGLVNREVALLPAPAGPLVESPGHDKAVESAFFVKYGPELLNARLVQGAKAPRLMKDTLEEWDVPEHLWERYVPDFFELPIEGETERNFLFVVRQTQSWEDGRILWDHFPDRRKALLAQLMAAGEADDGADAGDPVE